MSITPRGAKGNARLAFVGQDFELAGRRSERGRSKVPRERLRSMPFLGVNAPAENWSRTRADGVKHALADWAKDHPDRPIKVDARSTPGSTTARQATVSAAFTSARPILTPMSTPASMLASPRR
jgi:simple sugar transport system substrate-binding protein